MSSVNNEDTTEERSITSEKEIKKSEIFQFKNEGNTLGNLLQGALLEDPDVLFAGYTIPHPLEKKMVLKVETNDSISARNVIIDVCDVLDSNFRDIDEIFKNVISNMSN